jgi:protein phosphatase
MDAIDDDAEVDTAAERAPAVTIPALALVVIAGDVAEVAALAGRWFTEEEIAHLDAGPLDELNHPLARRLAAGKLAVTVLGGVAARSSDLPARLAQLAHWKNVAPVALLVGAPSASLASRFPPGRRGFEAVHHVTRMTQLVRAPLACDLRHERGPFDIIGDVHGCYDELLELFERLGYCPDAELGMRPPAGRRAVFVGDLVDRGPGVVETLRLVMRMVEAGVAFCAPGNHDDKLLRALMGHGVWVAHGLRESLEQIERLPEDESRALSDAYQAFVHGLPPYLMLDGGALVVAHAGLPEAYRGRVSGRIRALALYGEAIGEDQYGLPIRVDWAADYRGAAAVVYGHTPQREAVWRNNTINIDTGCVFGGELTAARWPERELVSVPARKEYAHHRRPL